MGAAELDPVLRARRPGRGARGPGRADQEPAPAGRAGWAVGVAVCIGGGQALEGAWPALRLPGCAFEADEATTLPGDWAKVAPFIAGPPAPRAEWEALDARFRALYPAVLAGRADPAALEAVAARMGLTAALRHDRRPALPGPGRVDDGVLADVSENNLPELGLYATARVLGPLSERWPSRAARRACGAVLAFSRILPQALRPIDRFYRERPRPDVTLRGAAKAVDLCPPMLWRPTAGGGLDPLLPLAAGFRPPGPVDGVPAAAAVLGRAVPAPDGWWLACALPLPALPAAPPLLRRLRWELWRMRRHELRLTWEDLLRERAEVLTRSACEAIFDPLDAAGWRWPEW